MSDMAAAPQDEALYRESLQELRSPRPAPISSLVFIVLLVVFLVGAFGGLRSVTGVLLIAAAIFVHEAGHALGMRAFGFRDVKMFFIPFFGAAVSGRPRGAAAWKEAVVSLLGPLPGIVGGTVLLFVALRQPHPVALHYRIVEALLLLNAFNLLPFGFLDGGHFFQRVLFSRHRVLEVVFQAVGYVLLGWLAVIGSMPMLGLFALLALFGLPARWRTLSAAARLRREVPDLVADPDRLGEPDGRALFAAARSSLRGASAEHPALIAREMESILGAAKRAPGLLATLGLLGLYLIGFACALVGLVGLSLALRPAEWQAVHAAGWSAEFPNAPFAGPDSTGLGGAADSSWRVVVNATDRFGVTVSGGAGGDTAWMDARAAAIAAQSRMRPSGGRALAVAGHPGAEFTFVAPGRELRARMVAIGARRFLLTASAPKWGADQQRFLDSFAVSDSLR